MDSSEGSASNLGCRVRSRRGKNGRRRAPLLGADCGHQRKEDKTVYHVFSSLRKLLPPDVIKSYVISTSEHGLVLVLDYQGKADHILPSGKHSLI